jgi:hypothetical protein
MTQRTARRGGDGGQALPLLALTLVVLMIAAALAIDLSQLTNEKQELRDTLDASAQAGAYELPNATAARTQALSFAALNDVTSVPATDFWCIVGSVLSGSAYVVNTTHIPATCYPGPAPYTVSSYPALRCNQSICAIPCTPGTGIMCNTIRVADSKAVPYQFAPIIDVAQGDTGNLVSVACKGACGTMAPTPIDFAFVADRTGSMSTADRDQVEAALKSVLAELQPTVHQASLSVIGRRSSSAPSTCRSQPASSNASSNPWIAVGLTTSFGATGELWRAVDCLTSSGTGTHLAAPFNAARRMLLNEALPAGSNSPRSEAIKALVFMTDGEPNETTASGGAYSETIGNSDGTTACNNAQTASNGTAAPGGAKANGITVITIAFRLEGTRCDTGASGLTFNLSGCTSANASSPKNCTVTASGGSTYTWSGGTVSGTGGSKTWSALRNRTYTIRVASGATTVQRIVTCNNNTSWSCSAGSLTTVSGPEYVVDVLASMASNAPNGSASTAANGVDAAAAPCSGTAEADVENADGDYFFCTADAADLRYIYETAVSSVSTGVRFIRLPT